ncbi:MAG: serine hydroxymethyltransferase [Candidatus Micrarchaeota archaeon]
MSLNALKIADSRVYELVLAEQDRQMQGLELIPSENLVSRPVLEAMGTVLTNKYSEGYPGKRYYSGNEFIDQIEQLAIDRAKKLFNAEHANVQPHAGSPANMAAFYAVLKPGDKFMGLKLTEGGHLTHGHPVNFSGKLYQSVQYGVDRETDMLNYDEIQKMAEKEKPKLILSGYTAYPRKIDFKKFREIADSVGAICMADIAHIAGLCATGAHENPVPYFDIVTTTTHKTLRGPRGGMIMCKEELGVAVDKAVFPGLQGGPIENLIAAKAVAFGEALQPEFKNYAEQVVKNARVLAEELMKFGLRLVTNGTDNHLILIDTMNSKNLPGKTAENALEKAGMYCNKNTIPFDPRSPWDPSGIRIGTPTLTTRGMKEAEMKEVAKFMVRALDKPSDESELKKIKTEVQGFCREFQFYG